MATEGSISTFLREKLALAQGEREALSSALDAVKAKIEAKVKRAPKRPTKSADDITREIDALEYRRTTRSLPLAEEKKIIQEMNALRGLRAPLAEYAIFEAELNDLRDQRTALSQRLAVLSTTAREMREGIRKLDVLERLQQLNPQVVPFSAADIRVAELTVLAAHLPLLIGKKGSQLREIEASAGVVLDVDHPKDEDGVPSSHARLRITGFEAGIAAAEILVERITAQVDAEIAVSEGLAHYLLARAGAAAHELETACGVRLRVLRDEHVVAAHGLPEAVAALRAALEELEGSKVTIEVDPRSVAAVIGKSGANLKHLREATTGVDIGIAKPDEAGEADSSAFHVYGRPEATAAAAASLRGLITELSESEEAFAIPADAVPWLVGRAGERIHAFQREAGVYARVVRGDDAAAVAALPKAIAAPSPHGVLLVVRGNPAALAKARPAVAALLDEYAVCNTALLVTAAQARLLVGVGGATVKKLRAETGCQIDVVEPDEGHADDKASAKGSVDAPAAGPHKDGRGGRRHASSGGEAPPPGHAFVYVRGDADKVAAAAATVRALLQDFRDTRLNINGHVIGALLEGKGASLAAAIQTSTGARLDIARDPAAVKAATEAAAAAAEASAAAAADDASDGIGGGGRRGAKGGARDHHHHHHHGSVMARVGGVVTISGSDAAVCAAEARVREVVALHLVRVVRLPSLAMLGELVGKGGSNIKAFHAEMSVEVEVDRAAGALTLVGAAPALEAAAARLDAFFAKWASENVVLHVDPLLVPTFIGRGGVGIKALQEATGTTIHADPRSGELRISGPAEAVEATRVRITSMLHTDKAPSATLTVPLSSIPSVIGKGGGNLRKIMDVHGVAITVNAGTGVFSLRGEPEGVAAASASLRRLAREAGKAEQVVDLPSDRIGAVIGPKGARIRSLEADTGAAVTLPTDRDTASYVTVKLRGSEAAVGAAAAALRGLAAGRAVRVIHRSPEQVAGVQKHDALALAAIASSSGGRISAVAVFPPPPLSEDDDAAAALLAASRATIVVDGASDADVARAALAVDTLLAARFPSVFASLSVPASVFSELSASTTPAPAAAVAAAPAAVLSVASLRASTGATIALDADNSRVVAWGAPAQVAAVASALRAASADVAARRAELPISHWMGPAIVGKKGANLAALEAALPAGCSVKVSFDSEEARGAGAGVGPAHRGHGHGHGPALQTLAPGEVPHVSVTAPTPAALATALEHVRGVVAGLSKLRVFLRIPSSAFGSIIGKGGSIIKALQESTACQIDTDRDRGVVTVRGATAEAVAAGRDAVVAAVTEAGHHPEELSESQLPVPPGRVRVAEAEWGLVIGRGGETLRRLHNESGAEIRPDKVAGEVLVCGSSAAVVAAGAAAVRALLASGAESAKAKAAPPAPAPAATLAAAAPAAAVPQQAARVAAGAVPGAAFVPPGAPPTSETAVDERRRLRRLRYRERQRCKKLGLPMPDFEAAGGAEDGDGEEDEEAAAPAPAPAAPAAAPLKAAPAPAVAAAPAPEPPPAPSPAPAAPSLPPAAPAAAAPVASTSKAVQSSARLFDLGEAATADDILAALVSGFARRSAAPAPAPPPAPAAAAAAAPAAAAVAPPAASAAAAPAAFAAPPAAPAAALAAPLTGPSRSSRGPAAAATATTTTTAFLPGFGPPTAVVASATAAVVAAPVAAAPTLPVAATAPKPTAGGGAVRPPPGLTPAAQPAPRRLAAPAQAAGTVPVPPGFGPRVGAGGASAAAPPAAAPPLAAAAPAPPAASPAQRGWGTTPRRPPPSADAAEGGGAGSSGSAAGEAAVGFPALVPQAAPRPPSGAAAPRQAAAPAAKAPGPAAVAAAPAAAAASPQRYVAAGGISVRL